MCDYSLGGLPNRLAVDGEELVVHRFSTQSMGLASWKDLQPKTPESNVGLLRRFKNFLVRAFVWSEAPAVCIPPGASLILKGITPDFQGKWNIGQEESVLFVQTSAEVNTYRDAVCFSNGRQVLLQDLSEGMTVKVVSLGGDLAEDPAPAVAVPRRSLAW